MEKLTPTKIYRILITEFWDKFGGKKNNGKNYKEKDKLNALITMSKIVINYRKQNNLEFRRDKFDNVKYKRHNLKTHNNCFVCLKKAEHRHHIILLNNGGINAKRNCISLCYKCHKKIHNWLYGKSGRYGIKKN